MQSFKVVQFIMLILVLSMFSSCVSEIDSGEEAVFVYQPWFFGHGGVDPVPVKTGAVYTAPTTRVVRFNTKPFQIDEVFDDLTSYDNTPVDFRTYIKLQVISGKTPQLLEQFGKEWYENNIKEPYRTFTRNQAKRQLVFSLTTNPDTIDAMQSRLVDQVNELIAELGIQIKCISVTVGQVNPPEEVVNETIRTAAQKQRKKTEDERAEAELARKQAEINKAIADNAYRNNFGMTVSQYLELRRIENEADRNKIIRDSGEKVNVSMIMGNGIVPFFNAN